MAQIISIGASRHVDLLKARLGRELKLFEVDGVKVSLEESPAGKFTFLACRVAGYGECGCKEKDTQVILKHCLADIISDLILEHWEGLLIREIIRENYYYFAEEEKDLIYRYALRHINRDGEGVRNSIYWLCRKGKILQKVLEYLRGSNKIIIDGFIKFRLKEYISELRDAADRAVDDFLMEREYREFVQLLKYFVEIQEPKIEAVHVLIRSGGVFKLFDQDLQPLKSDYLDGFVIDLTDSEINYEDLLISALITIAPRHITLHFQSESSRLVTLDTINSVFAGRVSQCPGCGLCGSSLEN